MPKYVSGQGSAQNSAGELTTHSRMERWHDSPASALATKTRRLRRLGLAVRECPQMFSSRTARNGIPHFTKYFTTRGGNLGKWNPPRTANRLATPLLLFQQ